MKSPPLNLLCVVFLALSKREPSLVLYPSQNRYLPHILINAGFSCFPEVWNISVQQKLTGLLLQSNPELFTLALPGLVIGVSVAPVGHKLPIPLHLINTCATTSSYISFFFI